MVLRDQQSGLARMRGVYMADRYKASWESRERLTTDWLGTSGFAVRYDLLRSQRHPVCEAELSCIDKSAI